MKLKRTIEKLRQGNPRLTISAFEFTDHIWLFNIEVEEGFRNRKIGSDAIRALQQLGKPIALIPMSFDQQHRLEKFYKRLGFKWECDKRQMVWRPEK